MSSMVLVRVVDRGGAHQPGAQPGFSQWEQR
jgi:hypothetical protein